MIHNVIGNNAMKNTIYTHTKYINTSKKLVCFCFRSKYDFLSVVSVNVFSGRKERVRHINQTTA